MWSTNGIDEHEFSVLREMRVRRSPCTVLQYRLAKSLTYCRALGLPIQMVGRQSSSPFI